MFLASKASGWVHVDGVSPRLLLLWQPTDCWVAADHKMAQVTWPKSVRLSYSHFADEITNGGSREHKLGSIHTESLYSQSADHKRRSESEFLRPKHSTDCLSLLTHSLSLSQHSLSTSHTRQTCVSHCLVVSAFRSLSLDFWENTLTHED